MHEGQLDVDDATVARLVAAQFPSWAGLEVVRVPGSGTVNAIFRIGPGLGARFPLTGTDAGAAADLRGEASALDAFADVCPVPAPRHVAFGAPGEGYPLPWAVQTWIEGAVATPAGLAGSSAFAADLGRLVATLRAVDTGGRTFSAAGRGGHLPTHDEYVADCIRRSADLYDPAILTAAWAALRSVPRTGADVLSHRDLIPANLLTRGGRLAGVLDAGGFGPADPALDLVAAWHLLDGTRRGELRERLRSGEDEWLRGAAWAFVQAMGLVWYYRVSNPVMAELGRSTLDRVLGDPGVRGLVQARPEAGT